MPVPVPVTVASFVTVASSVIVSPSVTAASSVLVAPEVLAAQSDPETYIAETKTFLDAVQLEDKNVVEGIFAGAKAPLSSPGPLSWLERENHEFTQYLARRLCD